AVRIERPTALGNDAGQRQAPLVRMTRRNGRSGGGNSFKVLSEFTVAENGKFRYDGKEGHLPKEVSAALIDQLGKANTGPGREDGGSVSFEWRDADGTRREKVFSWPEQAPDCQKLLGEIDKLVQKHAK